MKPPDVEAGKIPGRAGGCAASATDADIKRRINGPDKFKVAHVAPVQVGLAVIADRISKVNHSCSFLNATR